MKIFLLSFLLAITILFCRETAQAQTGSVTGTVLSCYTGLPMVGIPVVIGSVMTTTNSSGVYLMTGVPAGPVTVIASAAGYSPSTGSGIVMANQVTTINLCLNPIAGHLSGIITNCVTGNPVIGAKITFGTYSTYSVAGGFYSIAVYPGLLGIPVVSAPGFDNYAGSPVFITPPNTITLNVPLHPQAVTMSVPLATLNTGTNAVDLIWNNPSGLYQYIYDDGVPEQCNIFSTTGSMNAVKFTPCAYPAVIKQWSAMLCGSPGTTVYNDICIYADDGPGGLPGTVLAPPFTVASTGNGWKSGNLPDITINSGGFYVVIIQQGILPDCAGVSVDTNNNQSRSYYWTNGTWTQAPGNLLIRASAEQACGNVPPSLISYTVSRFEEGQENNQTLWTTIGTTAPGVTSFTDSNWGALPCGPYRWAVKANYACNGVSAPALSNKLGKCWTANVTIQAHRCCISSTPVPILVHARNNNISDTLYQVYTDTSGMAIIYGLWKGSYVFWMDSSGCLPVPVNATINGDTTIDLHMVGVMYPISNLQVNDTSLIATWNPPSNQACLIGYGVSLNNTISAFVPDTICQLPFPFPYGQPFQVCVDVVFNYYSTVPISPVCGSYTSHFLEPPDFLNADTAGCSAILGWSKPHDYYNNIPQGLLGYYIYRNNNFVHFCPSADSLTWTETGLTTGNYHYSVTAYYDLTLYGFPGTFGESHKSLAADSVSIICTGDLPLTENWNSGSFSPGTWNFVPSQNTWSVLNTLGNPAPSANFFNTGKSITTDYSYSLESNYLTTSAWACAEIWLKFDLKLDCQNFTSSEKMTIEIYYDDEWHYAAEFTNSSSFDWTTQLIPVNDLNGSLLRIRFRCNGNNTSNVNWFIDNISVYGACLAPLDLQWTANQQQVDLSWASPCTGVSYYNIYRTDSTANEPFIFIDSTAFNHYTDIPNAWTTDDSYRYFVTEVQLNPDLSSVFCESASTDTVLVEFPVGIPKHGSNSITVYPNPSSGSFKISSDIQIKEIVIMNSLGSTMYENEDPARQVNIKATSWAPGIYFVKITNLYGNIFKKIIVVGE